MAAINLVPRIFFRFLGLPADAESADIVVAAVGHKNVVEVPQADRAVVLKDLSPVVVLDGVLDRELLQVLDLVFRYFGLYSDLRRVRDRLRVALLELEVCSLLFFEFRLVQAKISCLKLEATTTIVVIPVAVWRISAVVPA